jgi:uncharacterized protein
MDMQTAKILINNVFQTFCEDTDITFAFQGGEPTCAGLSFFNQFTKYVSEQKKKNHHIHYALQTNGTLIDDNWIQLLKDNNFLVGLSIDGPIQIHNSNRIYQNGGNTYTDVMRTMDLLKHNDIQFNVLSVLTDISSQHPAEITNWIISSQIKFIQFIPCLPEMGKRKDQYCLTPQSLYSFYHQLMPLWEAEIKRGNIISISFFENIMMLLSGYPPQQCGSLGFCNMQYVIESNGNVYPCDFYATDQYLIGNIKNNSIKELAINQLTRNFLSEPRSICALCSNCRYASICNGQCKRLSVCYYNTDYCGYKQFLEEHESDFLNIMQKMF